jgi:hypothetical protein
MKRMGSKRTMSGGRSVLQGDVSPSRREEVQYLSVLPSGALLGPKHGLVYSPPQKANAERGCTATQSGELILAPSRDRLSHAPVAYKGKNWILCFLPGLSGAHRGRWVGRSPMCVAAPPRGWSQGETGRYQLLGAQGRREYKAVPTDK